MCCVWFFSVPSYLKGILSKEFKVEYRENNRKGMNMEKWMIAYN